MEVHHHAHTSRKKWTHYFWEFLMLFLAVFCGFLAEYQLEHKIEKNRGKQYIHSFYEDLVYDTARFTYLLEKYDQKINGLKIFSDCYHKLKNNKNQDPCLIQLLIHTNAFADIANEDRTLQQLKNAGGYRLLNKDDADSVFFYDNRVSIALIVQKLFQEAQTNLRNTTTMIFDVDVMNRVIVLGDSIWTDDIPEKILVTKDADLVTRYFNELNLYMNRLLRQREYVNSLLETARNLIYHFKNKYSFN